MQFPKSSEIKHSSHLRNKMLYSIRFFLRSPTQLHLSVNHQNPQAKHHRTNVFNLTYVLTYLQASTPTSYDSSREYSGVVPKDPSSKHTMLCLMAVTALALSHICDWRERRKRDQRQQDRLAALENGMMDLTGRLLPNPGYPLLDEDDDFKLPPPAYELHEGIPED